MDASNVQPMIEPDAGQMLRHVEHLFGGDLDGCHKGKIELVWTDTDDGHLRHAAIYGTDELEELVERAVKENRIPGQNVYIGQALRRDDIPPFGRCNDKDFLALTAFYVDLDDDGVVATARTSYRHRGCPPTAVVVTGRHPHVRVQALWRLETPERDAETCRRQNKALADILDGDPKVTNPSRVMRLGGSIAWPTKPGRIIERTEFVTFDDERPKVYYPGQLEKAFPLVDIAASTSPYGRTGNTPAAQHAATLNIGSEFEGVTVEACLAAIRAGQQWHNNMVRLVGHWIARGWSDAEVIAAAEGLTLEGYTVDQTRREVMAMISGGRAKWNVANPVHEVKDSSPPVLRATPLAPLVFEEIPARDWVVKRRLMRKFVSLVYGAGGINKSGYTTQEAVGVALGRAINGETFTVKQPGRVWIYNNEDPIDELRRRLAAICINWDIDPRKLESRLFLDSGLERRLIVTKRGKNIAVATPDVDALISEIQRLGIDLLVVDPFVRVHQVDENDNPAIDMVVQQFSRIATQCNCCISLIHHSRKMPPGLLKSAGNADNARGASALKDAVRLAHELSEMTERDADRLGVPDNERIWLVRLDDAKNNMSPPAEGATWFQRKSVLLPNGLLPLGTEPDNVGVLEPWTPPDLEAPVNRQKANLVLEDIDQRWRAGNPYSSSHQARGRYVIARMVKAHGVPKATAQRLLEDWFANGVVTDEVFDRHRKATGLRVLRFIDEENDEKPNH